MASLSHLVAKPLVSRGGTCVKSASCAEGVCSNICKETLGRVVKSRAMVHQPLALFSMLALATAGAQQYVAFDGASASSMYSAGNLVGSPAYAAQQALSSGSGYW